MVSALIISKDTETYKSLSLTFTVYTLPQQGNPASATLGSIVSALITSTHSRVVTYSNNILVCLHTLMCISLFSVHIPAIALMGTQEYTARPTGMSAGHLLALMEVTVMTELRLTTALVQRVLWVWSHYSFLSLL